MKTILVDAVDTFVIEGEGIYKPLHRFLEEYPNKKIVLTNADDEQMIKFGLTDLPYELFTLKHNPDKVDPTYFKKMLEKYGLKPEEVVYFEHNREAVKSAESAGIISCYYDPDKKDLVLLKKFLDENLRMKTTDPQDEVFDVVNEKDEVIGSATRAEVHSNKDLIHRVVHVWIVNDKDEILIQQRSLAKDSAPGMWDISCGGHIQNGHNPGRTAERELQEELKISADCTFITKFLESDLKTQTEMIYLYYTRHNGPFEFPKDEIQKVKFFTKKEAMKFIQENPMASFFSKKEIPIVFEFLEIN